MNPLLMLMHIAAHLHPSDMLWALSGLFVFSAIVRRLTHPNGPMLWPVLGILPTLYCNLNDVHEWATRTLIQCGGTFRYHGMWFSRLHGIMTVDPANLEYMLKTRFSNFPKGRYYRERFGELLGDGIFNADDAMWREQRRAATAEMHSARFVEYSQCTIHSLVHKKLLKLIDRLAKSNQTIDLQDVLLRFTFDNICTAAFGIDPGCLAEDDLPEVPFARAFENATEFSLFRFMVPPIVWKTMRFLNIGSERKLKETVRVVHEFAENTVSDRRTELVKLGGLGDRFDLLSRLVEARNGEGGFGFSVKFMKDFCISFILAGRDTSSVALAWFFWLVDRHPVVEKKILDEIVAVLGERTAKIDSLDDVIFTAAELNKMDYLQAAISETLRLYPSVPVDFKEAVEDDQFPDGTEVRSGAKVYYVMYSMGRMPTIWGEDCREFKPERWIKEGGGGGGFASESMFKYPVFNAGPRLCVGKKFAYAQMKTVVAAMLLRYEVKVVEGHVVTPKLTTTLYMKNGLVVSFKRRRVVSPLLS
ncbi:Cytochrome P450 86B1 [Acorus calamus]|uniref:Cytochrome P450 86B1 n=1 Tax=Acorus calamus TaxID=4465 RepID=A0AAV9F0K9_ACOCL|nr:Cytochrome P450 86B1 [Acorus calamus]